MNHKVLLADDSLTIQKVIKITLANQPYDITDCSSEEELFKQLPIIQPKLVFLDFNLSEKYTGYELTTKIKSLMPSAKVLLLLGTFDTVDDEEMEKCGASDKIVKPFDSNKFIAISKQLIETFPETEESLPFPEEKTQPSIVFTDSSEDQWTVSHTTEQKLETLGPVIEPSLPQTQNPLMKEMADWGMNVPGVIDNAKASDGMAGLPPVIGEVKSLKEHKASKAEAANFTQKFPENDDLDYPLMEDLLETPKETPQEKKTAAKLISIETFNAGLLELEGSYVPDESDVSSIEAQIRDQVEEDLWQADEYEDLKKEVSSKMEQAASTFRPTQNDFDESLFKPLDDNEPGILFKDDAPKPIHATDTNDMKREMEALVKKYVKEYMDELFQKNAEKVAWEVIPDLAENLIRQELGKISNKIIND